MANNNKLTVASVNEKLDSFMTEQRSVNAQILALLQSNGRSNSGSTAVKPFEDRVKSASEKSAKDQARREAEREVFKANYKTIYTAKENTARVVKAMEADGLKGFQPREVYNLYASKLGVLGKSGKTVGTYEKIK